jgi:hypothetical protein
MPRSLGMSIADALTLSIGYAQRMLKDVPSDKFARYAAPGGQIVTSNHGAFVYGHLSLYGPRIVKELGGDVSPLAPPPRFETVFSRETQCIDDVDGTVYPAMAEITEFFFRAYGAVKEALLAASDDVLQRENPTEGRMRELFPTLGSMHAFLAGGHMMMHLGQVSAWRRMLGLSPA